MKTPDRQDIRRSMCLQTQLFNNHYNTKTWNIIILRADPGMHGRPSKEAQILTI